MIYGSVCSGIEAATVAWQPLGWEPAWFAEIEKFPSAVLAHHYPDVPNHGDFTRIETDDGPAGGSIDLLVGGTPCQSFSVAGKRAGLDDPRGNLTLEYLALAGRLRPRWLVWENVPGVLSIDDGRTLGAFLRVLGKLGYGWAYRVLDAQYCRVDGFARAVPQRRRRVFVVGHLGDWRRAAAVLLEPESMRGHPAPRREAGPGVAQTLAGGSGKRGYGSPSGGGGGGIEIVAALTSKGVGTCGADDNQAQAGHLIAAPTLNAGGNETGGHRFPGTSVDTVESLIPVAHSLRGEGFDAGEDGTGRGTPIVPIAFSCKDHGADAAEMAPTLRAMGHGGSHANAGGQVAVALDMRGREGGAMPEGPHETANIRAANGGSSRSYVATDWSVRRLTPRECERLQGFPDDFTAIPWRGKPADKCPDGPRYKALGNSMAVNCMRWIGRRIEMADGVWGDIHGAAA